MDSSLSGRNWKCYGGWYKDENDLSNKWKLNKNLPSNYDFLNLDIGYI